MKSPMIADVISNVGAAVDIQLAVISREIKRTLRGGQFMTLTLGDRTGSIDAVWFNLTDTAELIAPETVLNVYGAIGEYNGKPQLAVNDCRVAVGDFDPADFLPSTKYDVEVLWETLIDHFIKSMDDPDIRRLCHGIVSKMQDRLKHSPAGMKVHHCFVGGLLEHIVSMCCVAGAICGHYNRLNRDLLLAGCILHDIGKIWELKTGLAFGYTVEGTLLGHIAMAYDLIGREADEIPGFSAETRMLLQHMVLSHHGKPEHGAVKVPMTPEAIILNLIDGMDARLEQAFRLMDETPTTDAFTAYIPAMERRLYCGQPAPTHATSREQAA